MDLRAIYVAKCIGIRQAYHGTNDAIAHSPKRHHSSIAIHAHLHAGDPIISERMCVANIQKCTSKNRYVSAMFRCISLLRPETIENHSENRKARVVAFSSSEKYHE